MTLFAFHLGPIAFDQPVWLILAPILAGLALLMARRSLSGMGPVTRTAALVIRTLVILLIVAAIARPSWRRQASGVNVTVIVDESDSVRRPIKGPDGQMGDLNTLINKYIDEAAEKSELGDTVARVTAARKAFVQSLPVPPRDKPDSIFTGDTDATNLAAAVTLSMAIMPSDKANRILLISDGNQTAGNVLAAANAAKAANIPIDVLPQRYAFTNEILVDRIVAPGSVRMGQNVNLRIVLSSLKPAKGKLDLTINGDPVDINDATNSAPDSASATASLARAVTLEPGTNIITIPVRLGQPGPQRFDAIFTPDDPASDSIAQNNRSMAVTFVQSEGRVLLLAPEAAEAAPIARVLQEARIAADVRLPSQAPTSLIDWGAYDAVVLTNCSAANLSQKQQEDLRSYIHDLGGGLVMVGGPESFGAGGWIGSPLADALPVKLDPPQKRNMPRGALALLMHSCEAPDGNYWGQQTALAAVNNLSRLDLAGIYEYSSGGSGDTRVYPMSEVGNKGAITRAINSLTYGDMPSFDSLLTLCVDDLVAAKAGAKHCIIISDGDPQLLNATLLPRARQNRISISTVLIYPHNRTKGGPDWGTMERIAKETGGNFYPVLDQGQFAQLPSIFIKEAQVVKRSLIWEGEAFSPTIANTMSEPMRGLGGGFPSITGYIVAADRDGLSLVTLRGKENDPLLAHWQYGLGKSVAFLSDTAVRWAKAWPSWGKYRAFWEQHVRWAMRPGGSADMRVLTEDQGDRTKLIVEALDQTGERLNFVAIRGKVVGPNNTAQDVELRQVGPGRYETTFDSALSGAYVTNLRYTVPPTSADAPSTSKEGNLQSAITRPYADEFRLLQDNAALLKLVAERTGGRVIDADPRNVNLWDRKGLTLPVALTPIWLLVALVGLGVFVLDVAVRRVRIDPAIIVRLFRRATGKSISQGSQSLGSLKQVRERAQAGMTQSQSSSAPAHRRSAPTKADKQTSSTKFEASAEELSRAQTLQGAPGPADAPGRSPVKVQEITEQRPDQQTNNEEGLSRLKKARQRAQDKNDDLKT